MPRNRISTEIQPDVSMTSMVDVVFLLLIFFVVTAAFQLQKSIAMPPPHLDVASSNKSETPSAIELHVGELGDFWLVTHDSQAEIPGKQNLTRRLKDVVANDPETNLLIKAHQHAKLQSLVDAIDAATIAGLHQLSITQVDSWNQPPSSLSNHPLTTNKHAC